MKSRHSAAAAQHADDPLDIDDEDAAEAAPTIPPGADVCESLTSRYAASSAPQHRHLIATAAALRSLLSSLSLPLTPPAYFAAAITALRDTPAADPDALAALAAFLSILLPLTGAGEIAPARAKDAVDVVSAVLRDCTGNAGTGTGTGTVRSLISSLGALALRVDMGDWSAVEVPLETLLVFAVDKRPKVRRCAQVCVDKVFKALQNSIHKKKMSKVILSLYKKYAPSTKDFTSIKFLDASQTGDVEFLHMLNSVKLVVPCLSEKVKMKILSDAYKLLHSSFSWHTRHVLGLLQCLFDNSKARVLVPESENIISTLTSYVSVGKKNPRDTVLCASILLKCYLSKLHDIQPNICMKNLPLIVKSLAGLLDYDVTSKGVADVLEELINVHMDKNVLRRSPSQSFKDGKGTIPEEAVVISVCTVFDNILSTCKVLTEHMLAVTAVLFLKLGEFSFIFMKEIVLKLSRWVARVDEDTSKHLQVCIGAAVVAMGPEKFLTLIPISFDAEKLTCSNAWLLSILKKYTVGASLHCFMECIMPILKSLQDVCSQVNERQTREKLESYSSDFWGLLPTFCCYPTDISQNFESLAKLLIHLLKDEPALHETIGTALQNLVNVNRYILGCYPDDEQCSDPTISFLYHEFHIDPRSLPFYYSKKTASRNMKALVAHSLDLFQAFTDIFLDSPPEKRKYLKETTGCLASIIGDENLQYFFVSSIEKFKPTDVLVDSGKPEGEIQLPDKKDAVDTRVEGNKQEDKRCLFMELTSSFVKAANSDLIDSFVGYIQSFLKASDETCHREAYHTLSLILKEHSWFCAARVEVLMELLLSVKSSGDSAVMRNRLSCYHHLLVHMLMSDEENNDARAFLILNEIILILKSKEESRKLAYDVLLEISGTLKNSQLALADTVLLRLFNMVMGYLSSPSPHIISGAVSALSLLIYNDACFCLSVPNLVPSVLVLLQNKDNEVIKACLGFIKVLVSSLSSGDLLKLVSDILDGILPWLTVYKHHCKSKVEMILEILMRKCGPDTITSVVPEKYQRFVRKVAEARKSKKNHGINSDAAVPSKDSHSAAQRHTGHKRVIENISRPDTKKSSKSASRSPRKKGKHEKGFSATNGASRVAGKDGYVPHGKVSRSSDNSDSKKSLVARPSIRSKVKRIPKDKPRGGNKMKIGKKKDANHNYVAEASISGALTKPNRTKRLRKS